MSPTTINKTNIKYYISHVVTSLITKRLETHRRCALTDFQSLFWPDIILRKNLSQVNGNLVQGFQILGEGAKIIRAIYFSGKL